MEFSFGLITTRSYSHELCVLKSFVLEEHLQQFVSEIHFHEEVTHHAIVRPVGFFLEENVVYLRYPYYNGGCLRSIVHRDSEVDVMLDEIRALFRQVFEVLSVHFQDMFVQLGPISRRVAKSLL